MPQINFGTVNTLGLAEYFVKKYNMQGRDAMFSKNRPTLMALTRDSKRLAEGDGFFETVKVAPGFSASPDWVEGNRNHSPSTRIRWQVGDPFAQYGYLTFDTLALQRNNLGTLIDIKGSESDDVSNSMLDVTEFELWNDGTGNRGQVASGAGTTATLTLSLTDPSTVYNFPIGAILYGDTAATGSGGTTHTNRYKVVDLDPQGGKIVVQRTLDNTSPIANNDFLFLVGTAGAYMPGIPTFIPASAPADTLYGVQRTANPALSGWRFPFKGSIGETISRAFAFMGRWVNMPGQKYVAIVSTTDWMLLDFEREGKTTPDPNAVQKWGLEGLLVRTPFGPVTVIAIPQLTDGRGYIIDWSVWKLYTLRNLPHVVDEDGQMFIRGREGAPDANANGDFVKMQFRIWKLLLCLKPMANATFATR